ncbi:MAG: hypothetical protein IJZ29_04295 [Clostridia bacterium]|nr:hypothetical protein [Clostridia bacterium]
MDKFQKKKVKQIIKEVRNFYVGKYNNVVSYLLANEEEVDERVNDVILLITKEKHCRNEIEEIKLQLELQEQEERFRAMVDNEVTAQEYMLAYLEEQTTLLEEELQRVESKKETRAVEIRRKQKRIDKLNSRLSNLARCKEKVQELIAELAPQKRKVGRPKKIKVEENKKVG